MAEKIKPSVFVSYSHEDEKRLEELLPYLEQLELNEHVALWHDRLMGVGEDWYRESEERLSRPRSPSC